MRALEARMIEVGHEVIHWTIMVIETRWKTALDNQGNVVIMC